MLTETITWRQVADGLPDAELTVNVATQGCEEPTWLGFHDGTVWRDVDGMEINVTHWAEMLQGPSARGVRVLPDPLMDRVIQHLEAQAMYSPSERNRESITQLLAEVRAAYGVQGGDA